MSLCQVHLESTHESSVGDDISHPAALTQAWDGANLTLVLQAVLANDLHLRVETVLLERALRLTEPEQYVCEINALFPAMLG